MNLRVSLNQMSACAGIIRGNAGRPRFDVYFTTFLEKEDQERNCAQIVVPSGNERILLVDVEDQSLQVEKKYWNVLGTAR